MSLRSTRCCRPPAPCAAGSTSTRPVDNQLMLDCIDLAEQAPTGGNLGSRRWVVVRDQAVKDQLGELYRTTVLPFMAGAAERLRGSGRPEEKVMASAAYLAEHLAEVPAIVIPTIIGRHDGSGRPGLFDSVIQAAWSFCLALRARGLGTTWVTAALQDEAKVKEILGIPEHMTEIVLLPVAWTTGTDFRRAPRHPARAITYFDRFGRTSAAGPGSRAGLRRRPRAVAEIDIDASAAAVWALVTDIDLPARFSTEFVGADMDRRRPRRRRRVRRAQPAHGDRRVDGPLLRRRLRGGPLVRLVHVGPGATRAPGGASTSSRPAGRTRLRFSSVIGPGPSGTTMAITSNPGKEARVLRRRLDEVQANMQAHRRRHQGARRGVAHDAARRRLGPTVRRDAASTSSARPSASASTRCGCPSSGAATRSRRWPTSPRQTSTVRLCTGIVQLGRAPRRCWRCPRSRCRPLSGGRFVLGVGTSGPQVMEGWHGVRFDQPVRRTRETIEIIRTITAGERLEHHGEVYELPLPGGEGRAIRSAMPPAHVPDLRRRRSGRPTCA